ncbi:MAG: hypothetical protein KKF62_08865 [Bacteroidetes bacterium]|nr:hypothetical protein [Bacteroidota bacterium]MBU1115812.1 hypothetical protein [Bacteroidota bacterium]MBU1800205.1 hypothetical protein [Bacteroidota bacterium]
MRKADSKSVKLKKIDENSEHLIWSIISKYNMSQPDEVKKECDKLLLLITQSALGSTPINLEPLFPLLQKRADPIAEHIFSFLEETTKSSLNPLNSIKAMLNSRDKKLALRALEYSVQLAEIGILKVDRPFILFLAERMSVEKSPFLEAEAINNILQFVKRYHQGSEFHYEDPLLELYLKEDNMEMRYFAAQLLDKSVKIVNPEVAEIIIGKNAYSFFQPYLEYTRATHVDLLCFQPLPSLLESLKDDFIHAKEKIGNKFLNEIIAKLGWDRINFGLQIKVSTGVSINNSPPFMVSDIEASILDKCKGVKQNSKTYLIIACGGLVSEANDSGNENNPITRFRSFNLNHASLLRDFLDVSPLNEEKIRSIIDRMDQIVEDYVTLFHAFSDECTILPGIYNEIKTKVMDEIIENNDKPQLSANLTRLVQSFEDPRSLGEVHTLHGLKRYLHQHALGLGFRLVERSKNPNRTVDILIAKDDNIEFILKKIRFADFEPTENNKSFNKNIPFSVELLIDGFSRQMLHGHEQFPHVNIYCYGNEVHYYFGFRNHPVLLRIDYAPPLHGGMIDLEYFGVSNYEIEQHPNISLDVIRTFFQKIDFEIQIVGTHIHARYDKERALNLGDLYSKAQQVFRLVPYFMDLDWIVGSLALEKEARQKLANAWAKFFLSWGFIPLKTILTKNRTGIIKGFINEPIGQKEIIWDGKGSYEDVFTGLPNSGLFKDLLNIIRQHGFENSISIGKDCSSHPGQIELEECFLTPLRKAIDRGELIQIKEVVKPQSSSYFIRVHEAELFAEILVNGHDKIIATLETACIIRQLERILTFKTTGSINGYQVQKATLTLRNEEICFFILRGIDGIIKLAFYTLDHILFKKRENKHNAWIENVNYNVSELALLLRINNYVDTLSEYIGANDEAETHKFLEEIKQNYQMPEKTPLRGVRILNGLKASPGRTVGKTIFGTEKKSPQDFSGSILVAPSLKPEDASYLYYADGIVSTGGGILSHAGLIAMQFRKPALIISGKWQSDASNQKILIYKSLDYKIIQKQISMFNVCIRTDIQEKEYSLLEGDLVLLDAIAGNIQMLGQGRDVIALNEGFGLYRKSNEMLTTVKMEKEILNLRGKLLRARHQLENVLYRCSDPIVARYGIFEILLNETSHKIGMLHRDKVILLSILLNNKLLADDTRDYLLFIMDELKSNFLEAVRKAENDIPTSNCAYEILTLRLNTIIHKKAIDTAKTILDSCNIKMQLKEELSEDFITTIAINRLNVVRRKLVLEIEYLLNKDNDNFYLRHQLRQLERINSILKIDIKKSSTFNFVQTKLIKNDNERKKKFRDNYVINNSNCGFELFQFIGWKAANLAEIERLSEGKFVPPWFVVTDKAFNELLESTVIESKWENGNQIVQEISLRDAINNTLNREDLADHQKSLQIRGLWERAPIPDNLSKIILEAYNNIISKIAMDNKPNLEVDKIYVAVRSSSREEDTEAAARAGEFETYLYVHGEDQLLQFLKLTWSGLWTERAIQHRAVFGVEFSQTGGGVIVQCIVNSRVSGVLQTVDVPRGNHREMVINAVLGLGEGIVSGTIAADQITVSKETDLESEPLRFSYITSDKTEQIIFNRRLGYGTTRAQTLYHQRLRPALEYVELNQLVKIAASLEKKYGYPLDIEFGFEDSRLWILQVRPVSLFLSILNETNMHFPLKTTTK